MTRLDLDFYLLVQKDKFMPRCLFCSSTDSMHPFMRPERVLLISSLFPRVRWRYCRACARHFITAKPRRPAPSAG